jgi:CheY-like chemotaxis protein
MPHILVVDDDSTLLKLTVTVLAKEGHTVTACSTGEDALRMLGLRPSDPEREPPDLVLLDIMMPKLDGYSLGRAIRESPRTRRVPILIISALAEMSRLFTATVQVEGFLRKPFAPEELIAEVARLLAGSGRPQA